MEKSSVLRRFFVCALAALVLAGAGSNSAAFAAQKTAQADATGQADESKKKADEPKKIKNDKSLTAEQVAETVVFAYGLRDRLIQIRRTGVERGRVTRTTDDGRSEEVSYERSFKRGETFDKDKIRLDQHMPQLEYSLIFDGGRVFGLLRGSTFTPRQADVSTVLTERFHGIDTLLRYKESGATLKYVGKESQKGLDLWLIDLTDKDTNSTRYYISAKTGRILWLEYEDASAGASPVKFKRSFHDYRVVQGTLVPYRSVLYAGDKQVEESQVLTVTYGVKMEDAVFQTPEAATTQP
jgi:hypothetical protein